MAGMRYDERAWYEEGEHVKGWFEHTRDYYPCTIVILFLLRPFHGVSTLIPLPYFTEPSPNYTQTLVTISVLRHHRHPTLHHVPTITYNKHLLPIITLVPYNQ